MEPIYVYQKDKGWIPESRQILTLRDGKTVALEHRKPQMGERYFSYSNQNSLDLHCRDMLHPGDYYSYFPMFEGTYFDTCYCTIVLVSAE